MALVITLHLLAVVIWVGGMFFAYMALRPAAGNLLEPPIRQTLWVAVFKRFFVWVWVSLQPFLQTERCFSLQAEWDMRVDVHCRGNSGMT